MMIGIIGQKGSGKTTAALAIEKYYGYEHRRFAHALKLMLEVGFGLTTEEIDGKLKELPCDKLCGVTPRWAMQSLGTEWARELIHPDIWVRAFDTACKNDFYILEDCKNVVVDDVRFQNEVDLVQGYEGFLIKITRGDEAKARHASEDIDGLPHDIVICNNGSIKDLQEMVVDAVEEERVRRYG